MESSGELCPQLVAHIGAYLGVLRGSRPPGSQRGPGPDPEPSGDLGIPMFDRQYGADERDILGLIKASLSPRIPGYPQESPKGWAEESGELGGLERRAESKME